MDYVKGSKILRERLGQVRRRSVHDEQGYADVIVSQEATARIRRWTGVEPTPESTPTSAGRSGRLKKRRR
jgi:hypothetical protein